MPDFTCKRLAAGPFPVVAWGQGWATFRAEPLLTGPAPWAVVVFARRRHQWLIANVPRGWCTPSGHIERGESPQQAARRETFEETGAVLYDLHEMGHYLLARHDQEVRTAVAFAAHVKAVGDRPVGSESTGIAERSTSQLPNAYWRWDVLMDAMFRCAELTLEESTDAV